MDFFWKKNSAKENSQQTIHAQIAITNAGYDASAEPIISKFQQIVERESDCDYDALRSTLLKARDLNFAVSMITLRRAYNDALYATAEVAYTNR